MPRRRAWAAGVSLRETMASKFSNFRACLRGAEQILSVGSISELSSAYDDPRTRSTHPRATGGGA